MDQTSWLFCEFFRMLPSRYLFEFALLMYSKVSFAHRFWFKKEKLMNVESHSLTKVISLACIYKKLPPSDCQSLLLSFQILLCIVLQSRYICLTWNAENDRAQTATASSDKDYCHPGSSVNSSLAMVHSISW